MSPYITLTRKAASIKLESAKRAWYYIQVDGGDTHSKRVSVEEAVRAFVTDDRARCRIDRGDSQHVITITDSRELRSGYVLEF